MKKNTWKITYYRTGYGLSIIELYCSLPAVREACRLRKIAEGEILKIELVAEADVTP